METIAGLTMPFPDSREHRAMLFTLVAMRLPMRQSDIMKGQEIVPFAVAFGAGADRPAAQG
jgi:hypothetical protein